MQAKIEIPVIIISTSLKDFGCTAQNQEGIVLRNQARWFIVNQIKFKTNLNNKKCKECYLLNREWYTKWKQYLQYKFNKNSMKRPSMYATLNRAYIINPELHPGTFDNSSCSISWTEFLNNGDATDKDNIFIRFTEKNYKNEYKRISKENWDLLNDYYQFNTSPLIFQWDENSLMKQYMLRVCLLPKREQIIACQEILEDIIRNYTMYFHCEPDNTWVTSKLDNILKAPCNQQLLANLGFSAAEEKNKLSINIMQFIPGKGKTDLIEFIKTNLEDWQNGKTITVDDIWKQGTITPDSNNYDYLIELTNSSSIFYLQANEFHKNHNYDINSYYVDPAQDNPNLLKDNLITPNESHIHNNHYHNSNEKQFHSISWNKKNNNKGIVGLVNIGNTCFMNSTLQCLSNCAIFSAYFLDDYYIKHINRTNPIGSKGILADAFGDLIKMLWYSSKSNIAPNKFKQAISKFQTMFLGYLQHDAHEFLSFLLDGLHEDLNKVINKPYISDASDQNTNDELEAQKKWKLFLKRNQSFLVDIFYGMLESTVYCSNETCNNISKTFDPFTTLSLSILSFSKEKAITCFLILYDISIQPIKFTIIVSADMNEGALKQKIGKICNIGVNTFEVYKQCCDEYLIFKPNESWKTVFTFLDGDTSWFLVQINPEITGEKAKMISYENWKYVIKENIQKVEMEEYQEKINENQENKMNIDLAYVSEKNAIDKTKYIKAMIYMYTYSPKPEERFSYPRVLYFDITWNNMVVYKSWIDYLSPILKEIKKCDDNIYTSFIPKPEDLSKVKTFSILNHLNWNEINEHYPFLFIYLKKHNINSSLMTLNNDWKDLIFPAKETLNTLNKIVTNTDNKPEELQWLFKLLWLPQYKDLVLSQSLNEITEINYEPNIKNEGICEWTELLENFSKTERLTKENEWYCQKCQTNQLALKKMQIMRTPEILILHLKRFRNGEKLETLVQFPVEGLNISNTLYNGSHDNGNCIYDLFAIINHYGGVHGGHYIAYAKNHWKNKWYCYNDEHVSEITKEEIVTNNAYVLFYKKRNGMNEEELVKIMKKGFEDIKI